MKLDVYATIADVKKEDLPGADAVVIDVLRMTSTVTNALENGAEKIKLIGNEDEARRFSKQENALLGGERGGVKLSGFAFGNSPLEYTREKAENQKIVMTTTNGARAAEAAQGAKSVRLCSFLNVSNVASHLKNSPHVIILCAGTHDAFSLDDCLCAGALSSILYAEQENDLSVAMRLLYEAHENDLQAALKSTKHYKYLKSIGFTDDLNFCLQKDTHACVPIMDQDGWFENEKNKRLHDSCIS